MKCENCRYRKKMFCVLRDHETMDNEGCKRGKERKEFANGSNGVHRRKRVFKAAR